MTQSTTPPVEPTRRSRRQMVNGGVVDDACDDARGDSFLLRLVSISGSSSGSWQKFF